jgi:urease gamma subunit
MFTLHEREKLLISCAAIIAKNRKDRGLLLNYPETVSIITSQVMEWAREGKSVSQIMSLGTGILKRKDLMPGIDALIPDVQVEATFPDGTKLVTIHNPIQE